MDINDKELNCIPEKESDFTFNSLIDILNKKQIEYKLYEHEPVETSQEAADVRKTSLESGAKAILISTDKSKFSLLVMSAAFKFNNKLIKNVLKSKKNKFADLNEVWKVTRCFNGAVPPFGSLFGINTYVDKSLINQGDDISFNAGLRTKSLVIKTQDYIEVENPIVCEFCDVNLKENTNL